MKKIIVLVIAVLLIGCGQSYKDQKRLSKAERYQLYQEDSAAFKVAVLPTLDCLPLFVAKHSGIFEQTGEDIRLKFYTSQMDCDTAMLNGRVELVVTDAQRMQKMQDGKCELLCLTATNAYWQLYANRMARIKELSQLKGKMVAMTRYSATDWLAGKIVDSLKWKPMDMFKVQINDLNIRYKMLQNGELDASFLTEPYATAARLTKHKMILDSRDYASTLGVIAYPKEMEKDKQRMRQLKAFAKAYDAACDSINKLGMAHYKNLIAKYAKVTAQTVDSLPQNIRFAHVKKVEAKEFEKVLGKH